MKVSEKTISVWTVVNLYKDCEFRNPSWVGDLSRMARVTTIGSFDTWDLRFWREFFYRFSEQVQAKESATEKVGFIPDFQKQMDEALEDTIDQ